MVIEAHKQDDGYFIPISGSKERIKVYLEEDIEELDVLSFLKNILKDPQHEEMSKEEFREKYGDALYRKYLLLDKKSMDENWEYLVRTEKDHGDGYAEMEEAKANWNKDN